jgi:hypothetical protein
MSLKRYTYKLIESASVDDFEQQLTAAGTQGWSAVGYGVLPGGQRSALMSRRALDQKHHHGHHHHGDHASAHDVRIPEQPDE